MAAIAFSRSPGRANGSLWGIEPSGGERHRPTRQTVAAPGGPAAAWRLSLPCGTAAGNGGPRPAAAPTAAVRAG